MRRNYLTVNNIHIRRAYMGRIQARKEITVKQPLVSQHEERLQSLEWNNDIHGKVTGAQVGRRSGKLDTID